jgi:hypothetical protein
MTRCCPLAVALAVGCSVDGASSSDDGTSSASDGSTDAAEGSSTTGLAVPRLLAAFERWAPMATESDDPYPAHRTANAECAFGFSPEDGTFEIDSELCTYALFEQPTLTDIGPGEIVRFNVVHDQLYAEDPATAHIAFALNTQVVYEVEIPIPSEYGFLDHEWTADQDIPEGTMLRLHLHNHGVNNYRVLDVKVR